MPNCSASTKGFEVGFAVLLCGYPDTPIGVQQNRKIHHLFVKDAQMGQYSSIFRPRLRGGGAAIIGIPRGTS
jgi:hypothetical protein